MSTIFDVKQDTKTVVTDRAAAEHNAQIKERYQRLQNVERSQFAQFVTSEKASVLAPERPQTTQSPVQRVEERVSPAYTVETLERTIQSHTAAPVQEASVVEIAPVQNVVTSVQAAAVEGVQLSRFAKVFLGACAAVVMVMICLICAFTQIINANQMKLSAMESGNAQLRAEYARVSEELGELTSPEAIEAFAKANGMIKS